MKITNETNARLPQGLYFMHPAALIATWFGAGLLPRAPGTWGSLFALPFAALIHNWGGSIALAVAAAMAFFVGWQAARAYLKAGRNAGEDNEDPGAVVIDEVAGQWLTLVVVPLDLFYYGLGFLLFRIFDIVKPWPAGALHRHVKGGLGIMLDDIAAAIYAGACLILLQFLLLGG